LYEHWRAASSRATLATCGSRSRRQPIRTEYLIVDKGKLAGTGAKSYTAGDATKGAA